MRRLTLSSALAVLCLLPRPTTSQSRPVPPGIREADKQTNKPLDAPAEGTQRSDFAQLKRQGDELAQLSAGVPADLARVTQGKIPKDLTDKLKRIEKLAKALRNQLTP